LNLEFETKLKGCRTSSAFCRDLQEQVESVEVFLLPYPRETVEWVLSIFEKYRVWVNKRPPHFFETASKGRIFN